MGPVVTLFVASARCFHNVNLDRLYYGLVIVSATLFPIQESWSVPLRETLVVLAGRFYYVGPCRLCYKGP